MAVASRVPCPRRHLALPLVGREEEAVGAPASLSLSFPLCNHRPCQGPGGLGWGWLFFSIVLLWIRFPLL